ncbi:MAG: serine protease, partial [Verrucomicrobiales bacterium]|nr:serine protease [Verrucomicrobiales bacterium]
MRCNFLLLSLLLPWVEPVTAAPFEDALRATVKLSGGPVTGTGFVIEKDEKHFLATAAHVMNDFKEEICQVVYRTEGGKRKEGNLKIRNGEKALWKRHET